MKILFVLDVLVCQRSIIRTKIGERVERENEGNELDRNRRGKSTTV